MLTQPRSADRVEVAPAPAGPGLFGGDAPRWIALLATALALRAALAWRAPLIEVDGAYWAGLAESLARGDLRHGFSTAWPPLYPALAAVVAAVARAMGAAPTPALFEACARSVSVVAGTLLLLPLAALARRLLPPRGAWLTVALAAFHPRLLQYSAAALSEMTYALLLVSGMALLLACEDAARRAAREAAAGACFGLAYLVRPEGLPLAGALWLAGIVRKGPLAARLRPRFALATLAVALPFLVFVHAELGRWSLGEKGGYNFWRAYAGEYGSLYPPPVALARRVNDSRELARDLPSPPVHALKFALRRPALVLGRSASNLATIVTHTLPVTIYVPFAALALAGLLVTRRGGWPVAVTLVAVPLLYAPLSSDRRFFVPLVPLLLPFAAGGIAWLEAGLGRRLRAEARARRVSNAACVALLAFGVVYAFARGARFDEAPEQRAAGEWLRRTWPELREAPGDGFPGREATARPVVMARKPWVAYYGGGLIASLPDVPLDSLLVLARRNGVDVLVADARSARADRPQLAPLLDPASAPGALAPLHRESGPEALVLYRLRRGAGVP